jgi:phosphatidate cytidylyltransferase
MTNPAEPLAPAAPEESAPSATRALGPRILSATILLPLGVAAVWFGGLPLAIGAALLGIAMAFEWARMSAPERPWQLFFVLAIGASVCAFLAGYGHFQWMAPFLAGCAVVAALLRDTWLKRLEAFCGAIYVGAPGAAFVWLRSRPEDGLVYACGLAAAIWATDIAAYVVGRAIGGPKIFPQTSPQKTWAGFWGGVIAAALAAAGIGFAAHGAPVHWAVAGGAVSVVGQIGDMFESLVKRHFRVKDASGFIPGHGGVMDRLDALMAASLFCVLALSLAPGLAPEIGAPDFGLDWR